MHGPISLLAIASFPPRDRLKVKSTTQGYLVGGVLGGTTGTIAVVKANRSASRQKRIAGTLHKSPQLRSTYFDSNATKASAVGQKSSWGNPDISFHAYSKADHNYEELHFGAT